MRTQILEFSSYFRSLIIRTKPYSSKDIEDILRIRAQEESVEMEADAFGILTLLAGKTSLRYAMQLISTGNILRERRRGEKVFLIILFNRFNISELNLLSLTSNGSSSSVEKTGLETGDVTYIERIFTFK